MFFPLSLPFFLVILCPFRMQIYMDVVGLYAIKVFHDSC
ncbi:hypothetical protein GLYMA_01G000137v4 [Glycine max]|nr:hypothetical protein GLYMA_01G000137v4 [Glycine max]KAH1160869.1 hypothetical protein GYH30_000002 [Glycine max]